MVNNHSHTLDSVFSALSDPTRRAILERVRQGTCTAGELAKPFDISLPAISRHLRVLEHAGLISRTREGRTQLCTFDIHTLREAARWLERYRRFWDHNLDALEEYLVKKKQ